MCGLVDVGEGMDVSGCYGGGVFGDVFIMVWVYGVQVFIDL